MSLLLARAAQSHRNISDPSFASVVTLLHMDGANNSTTFTDQKSRVWTPAGAAKVSTASPKFGSGALTLDGAGSYLTTPGTTDFVFGTGDFTIEFFIKTTQTGEHYVVDFYTTSQAGWQLGIKTNKLIWFRPGTTVLVGTIVVNDGLWHHIAVCRVGTTLRSFVDGVLDASTTEGFNYSYTTSVLAIGAQVATRNSIYDVLGQVDEVRITKGVGRYAAAFSPPSVAFPNH